MSKGHPGKSGCPFSLSERSETAQRRDAETQRGSGQNPFASLRLCVVLSNSSAENLRALRTSSPRLEDSHEDHRTFARRTAEPMVGRGGVQIADLLDGAGANERQVVQRTDFATIDGAVDPAGLGVG